MARILPTRRIVAVLGVAVLLAGVTACGSSNSSSKATTTTSTTTTTTTTRKATSTTSKATTTASTTTSTTSKATTTTAKGASGDTSAGDGAASGGGTTGGGSSAGDPTKTDGGASGSAGGSGATRAPDPYDGPGGGGPCVANADRLSGTSTVIWTADSASKHKDSDATVATTMRFQKDGSLVPRTLEVKVGEVFTFGLADGVSDIVSAKVGCDSGQTVLAGKALAAEYITTPGTYDVVNMVANKLVGTITVK